MRIISGVVFIIAACVLCGCSSMKGGRRALTIDFDGMTVAGIKPGDPGELVIEKLGRPYDIWYGSSGSPGETWNYYNLGIKVFLQKKTREVDEVTVYFNRFQAYSPFRGSIAQGIPLASRFVDVRPVLEEYREVMTRRRGYETVEVYDDSDETAYMDKEYVRLERDDAAKLSVYFDYDRWIERVFLEKGEPRETPGMPEGSVEETVGGEPGSKEAVDVEEDPGS
ncbi:MAG: hypothetical protein P9M00_07430 [Candidatus Tritonobacter lacicola]|nr:hypothetical protein [Candidatus Tritonobacter lacicola]